MKIEEVRSKTNDELDFDMGNMKKELFDLRFKSATSGVKSTAQINILRRSIARVETILHERALGIRGEEPKN
ncbi:MAG: 50S ribosomal protein L29 [Planctomycetes bacterium]|nr:50S ribosomal protein L29 [Planctomycetota bacterium]MCB9910371.1 50S ribosomal protein L29 [Planctomycetota bacterium]MCB9912018.1 50S ribosomal protein L29 [Planctomycetota bacterium]HPF14238.1 50S ribosomal protein L29 [Planctomycetota bacterium]HRV80558.1 50S ribosomal protein L29 [Planctomycetota bacterium]